jgi:hypothetical protein
MKKLYKFNVSNDEKFRIKDTRLKDADWMKQPEHTARRQVLLNTVMCIRFPQRERSFVRGCEGLSASRDWLSCMELLHIFYHVFCLQ